jgi:hypothetical protein
MDEWLSILGKCNDFRKVNQQTEPDWTIDLEDGPREEGQWSKTERGTPQGSVASPIVPTENSVQPMTGVIPPNEPQSSSGLRPCLNLVTEIFRWASVQGSAVQTEISKRQG